MNFPCQPHVDESRREIAERGCGEEGSAVNQSVSLACLLAAKILQNWRGYLEVFGEGLPKRETHPIPVTQVINQSTLSPDHSPSGIREGFLILLSSDSAKDPGNL